MLHRRFACLLAWSFASFAQGASFPMPKLGEWKVKDLEASGAKGKANETIECIATQDKKRWEEDFVKAARENGMDCQLTVKSESASRLAYDIRCKGRPSESGATPVQVYRQDAEGSLVFDRHSETSYTIAQEIRLRSLKPDAAAAKEMSVKEKRMVDAATRHSAEGSTTRMKNAYTFVSPQCK